MKSPNLFNQAEPPLPLSSDPPLECHRRKRHRCLRRIGSVILTLAIIIGSIIFTKLMLDNRPKISIQSFSVCIRNDSNDPSRMSAYWNISFSLKNWDRSDYQYISVSIQFLNSSATTEGTVDSATGYHISSSNPFDAKLNGSLPFFDAKDSILPVQVEFQVILDKETKFGLSTSSLSFPCNVMNVGFGFGDGRCGTVANTRLMPVLCLDDFGN